MSFAPTAPAIRPARESFLVVELAIAFALAALADWLFYNQTPGISVVIFAIALACGSVIADMAGLDRNKIGLAALILLAGLAPVVEEVNTLSLIVLFLALGLSLSHATNPDLDS
jgi:mannose/fructose/N-acetylgalactosamine-specific phosphotransferase system component IID